MSLSSSPQHLPSKSSHVFHFLPCLCPTPGHRTCLHKPPTFLSFSQERASTHGRCTIYPVSPCFAAVLRLRETQFRIPAGMLVLPSSTSHWTTSACQQREPQAVAVLSSMPSYLSSSQTDAVAASLPCLNTFLIWIEMVMYRWLADDLDVNVRVIRPQAPRPMEDVS
jgi:hypothetical protein